jgi:class 3 adenylate cyclase
MVSMTFREYHHQWEFDLKSTPESLWPFVADTNRFNRDTGVPEIEVDQKHKRLPNARRKVRFSMFGLPVEWEEQPFEWVRPERFGIERVYSRGPMSRLRVLAQLTPKPDGGTHFRYEVWATPRNVVGSVAIPLQLGLVIGPRFRAAIQKYDELAAGEAKSSADAEDASRSTFDLQRLASLKEKLIADVETDEKSSLAERLVHFIEHGDDLAVSRIRAYKLADDWHEPRRLMLEVCLRATRVGLLDFQWELLCPLCRGAKATGASLNEIHADQHCSTCQIDFTVNFDRYVELTFRPNPAVRRLEVTYFCVGSPQWTPHVVAQQLLPAGDERELSFPLEAGNYRLRALELKGSQDLTVSPEGENAANVTLSSSGWAGDALHLGEKFKLIIKNETDTEQLLMFERMEWSDQATTAAEVTALQMFRDLFATEALRPGEQISVGTLTILFTDLKHSTQLYREIGDATAFGRVMSHFDVVKKAIADHDGAVVKTIGDAVMAVFRSAADGLRAMLEAQRLLADPPDGSRPLNLKAGLNTGPCIAVTLNDRLDYFGSTVNMAARLEGLSSGSDVIISRSVYEDARVRELIESEGLSAIEFDMSLKGFEDERFELWRITGRPGPQ